MYLVKDIYFITTKITAAIKDNILYVPSFSNQNQGFEKRMVNLVYGLGNIRGHIEGNFISKNSYNIYISLGKRSIKYIAKIRKLLVIRKNKTGFI